MPSIDLSRKVKERLEKFKDNEGCKTFSEAVNVLLLYFDQKDSQTTKS